jgi:hypothetical protein
MSLSAGDERCAGPSPARSGCRRLRDEGRAEAVGRVTLHNELVAILNEHPNSWMTTRDPAALVNERGRYRKKDGSPVSPYQARSNREPLQLFIRDGSQVKLRSA